MNIFKKDTEKHTNKLPMTGKVRKPDCLHRTIDIDDHAPNPAALEVLRRCRDELPDLG